jgi:signal transduction histidine kinase/FixJ family two-component response regulator
MSEHQWASLDVVLDAIPFPVYIADIANYELVFVNRTMRERLQGSRGRTCHEVIFCRERPCEFCRIPELLGKAEWGVFELFNDVDDRWYQTKEMLISWYDGRVAKYSIAVDITALKEVQNALAEAHAELALTNRQLSAAIARAEAEARTKASFLAVMSHEIRTPVNGILGMAHLALDLATDPRQRKYLETMIEVGETMTAVLSDTLDFSKLEAGGVVLEREAFDPRHTVATVAQLLSSRAGEKGLELLTGVKAEVPALILGDATRLRQILLNLVTNAIKFTHAGRVEITVACEAGKRRQLRFEVSDTGIGISAEARRHLFQPFSQADATISRRFGGTGLGLMICRELVELHGGAIGVDSVEGEGSRFWFTLPCEEATPEQIRVPTLVVEDAGPPLSILVAEDVDINRLVVTAILEKLGHRVRCVGNGREAVDACRDQGFDVVLMDVRMPVMNGLEATRAIRGEGGVSAGVPVIALTAANADDEWPACRDAGMDGFLSKPFREQHLLAVLAEWGGKRSTRAEDRPPVESAADGETLVHHLGADAVLGLALDYSRSSQTLLVEIATAAAAHHREALAQAAHALKGAAGFLGLTEVTELTGRIEAIVHEDVDQAVALAAEVPAANQAALARLRGSLGG